MKILDAYLHWKQCKGAKPKKPVEKSGAGTVKPKISNKSAKVKPKKPVEARPRKICCSEAKEPN